MCALPTLLHMAHSNSSPKYPSRKKTTTYYKTQHSTHPLPPEHRPLKLARLAARPQPFASSHQPISPSRQRSVAETRSPPSPTHHHHVCRCHDRLHRHGCGCDRYRSRPPPPAVAGGRPHPGSVSGAVPRGVAEAPQERATRLLLRLLSG